MRAISQFSVFCSFSDFYGDWVLVMLTLPTLRDVLWDKRARKKLALCYDMACQGTSECRNYVFVQWS